MLKWLSNLHNHKNTKIPNTFQLCCPQSRVALLLPDHSLYLYAEATETLTLVHL